MWRVCGGIADRAWAVVLFCPKAAASDASRACPVAVADGSRVHVSAGGSEKGKGQEKNKFFLLKLKFKYN